MAVVCPLLNLPGSNREHQTQGRTEDQVHLSGSQNKRNRQEHDGDICGEKGQGKGEAGGEAGLERSVCVVHTSIIISKQIS